MNDHFREIPNVQSADTYELSVAEKWTEAAGRFPTAKVRENISFVLEISGLLSVEVLERAVQTVVSRHEALRTTFVLVGEELRQRIYPEGSFNLQINHIDISNYQRKEELSAEIINEERTFPFDIKHDHLLKVTLIRLSVDQFVFMIFMHPIIADHRSVEIIAGEVFKLYNAYSEQKENPLPSLRIQYKDFTTWHNKQLTGRHIRVLESYWSDQLAGQPAAVNFPLDFPENKSVFPSWNIARFDIGSLMTASLKNVAGSNETSLFLVLVTAIYILLNRYTGEKDIVIGVPVSTRSHPDLENQVGLYSNILLIRTKLYPGERFSAVLARVRQTFLAARAHEHYPYGMLLEKLGRTNEGVHFLLVNLFVQEGVQLSIPEVPGLHIKDVTPQYFSEGADLTFSFRKVQSAVEGGVAYNGNLFKRTSINRLIGNLLHVIGLVSENCDILTDAISLPEQASFKNS
jgi:microcystin synthetase protein McyC